ncbi:MAG: hypothetical protein D5R97_04070 [Candidatus Syntrophonatronum acetioxidans]|uniref:MurNAc-LAA domain-containing protein n=1 Tax=Candidatus Syntrophonatronum acetioxidans TaxID=1795816 RepID=A0A424YG03_9FIRM|nr:MAG: hypothetical protein D5R97_04070 [Candidatus Syntrophonatronum acetioxidans]
MVRNNIKKTVGGRWMFCVLVFILFFSCMVHSLEASSLSGRKVVIDPGHGGSDPGATGRVLGLKEKEVNLKVALELRRLLEGAGAQVYLTRDRDVSVTYEDRTKLAARVGGEVFVSIHANSFMTSDPHGTETYYSTATAYTKASQDLAHYLQAELLRELGRRDRGVKTANFIVLRNATVPAALVELAFLSHKEEEKLLADPQFQAAAARALFKGLENYFAKYPEIPRVPAEPQEPDPPPEPVEPQPPAPPQAPPAPEPPPPPPEPDPVLEVSRVAGQDRYATSAAISRLISNPAETVILARGDDYADALAGAPLAEALKATLLLTRTEGLPSSIERELDKLKPRKVIILGGVKAVSARQEESLQAKGYQVDRIAGANRYDTAAEIAYQLAIFKGGGIREGVVVTGESFPDALAAGAYAAREGIPIIPVRRDNLPGEIENLLNVLDLDNVIVIGGEAAVSSKVYHETGASRRVYGADRYRTAVAVARELMPSATSLVLARGDDFADALGGSLLAVRRRGTILLSYPDRLPSPVAEKIDRNNYQTLYLLGGPGALSPSLEEGIAGNY